jgi:hypothetical protein
MSAASREWQHSTNSVEKVGPFKLLAHRPLKTLFCAQLRESTIGAISLVDSAIAVKKLSRTFMRDLSVW